MFWLMMKSIYLSSFTIIAMHATSYFFADSTLKKMLSRFGLGFTTIAVFCAISGHVSIGALLRRSRYPACFMEALENFVPQAEECTAPTVSFTDGLKIPGTSIIAALRS